MADETLATTSVPKQRLASIDIYRGMVMFLMLAEMLHLDQMNKILPSESKWSELAEWVVYHTSHVEWRGCSLHDMIQPSFSFLVGTAMAFSLVARSAQGQSWIVMFGHAILRSLILIFLGIFLRSLGKPITNFTFDDTLTQIGLGYWVMFLLSSLQIRGLSISVAVILCGYWIAFVAYPAPGADFPYQQYGVPANWPEHYEGIASHFNKNSNLAWAFDQWWMNSFPREKAFEFSVGGYCTLSFIPTLATMLLGLIAGRILQLNLVPIQKQKWLWISSAACLTVGIAIDASGLCPIVKRIWTPSWALWSGGVCFAWLACLNVICDMWKFKIWGFPFMVIGANSIVAYVMSWTVETPIHQAFERHFGSAFSKFDEWEPLAFGVATFSAMWLVLLWLYCKRIFVKI